jgi:hypothetical protein
MDFAECVHLTDGTLVDVIAARQSVADHAMLQRVLPVDSGTLTITLHAGTGITAAECLVLPTPDDVFLTDGLPAQHTREAVVWAEKLGFVFNALNQLGAAKKAAAATSLARMRDARPTPVGGIPRVPFAGGLSTL